MTFTNLKKYVSSKKGLKQGRPPLQPNPSLQTKSKVFSGQKGLYSTANDPQPQMIPRPQMIPKMDRKWSSTATDP